MIIYVDYNDDDIDNDNQDKLNDSRTNLVNIYLINLSNKLK